MKIIKKISDILEKKEIRYALYLVLALITALFHNLDNQDEVWNFNFANCISNGLLPYRDFNLLQTPFSCFINGIALLIFGHHLVVIRITGAFLFTGIMIQSDRISRQLGSKRAMTMVAPLAFLCMFFWNVFLEYSCFIVFVSLFAMRYDLEIINGERKNTVKYQLLVGILLGCGMMCKQTTGTFMAVSGWLMCFITALMAKSELKPIKATFFRMLGSSIPCFIFLFYLLGTGTFKDFWDMCYLGIFTFSSSYPYLSYMMENVAFFISGALLPLLMIGGIVVLILKRKELRGKQTLILLVYSAFSCLHMIPLANSFHVALAALTIMYLVYTIFPKKFFDTLFVKIVSGLFVVAAIVFLVFINPITDIIDLDWVTDTKGLELTMDTKEGQQQRKEIIEFVAQKNKEGNTVYILDNFAPLYFLPSNQYHKYLDMFLNGNLGTITPLEVLESTPKGSYFLLPDASRNNYQMPRQTEEEYMSKLTNLGRICDYTIYQK